MVHHRRNGLRSGWKVRAIEEGLSVELHNASMSVALVLTEQEFYKLLGDLIVEGGKLEWKG